MPTETLKQSTIASKWEYETGKYDDSVGKFVDKNIRFEDRIISIYITQRGDDKLIKFDGPTGFEIYNIHDIEEMVNSASEEEWDSELFCICMGTINS